MPAEPTHGTDSPAVDDKDLTRLFSKPRPLKPLLAGLRVLGFSADSVQQMTAAKSRDVVYAWAAERSKPNGAQAQRLDDIRRILYFICRHEELGPSSAWMLFNSKFGEIGEEGPTVIELIGKGQIETVIENLSALVDDDHGDGGGGEPPDGDEGGPSPKGARAKVAPGAGVRG